MMNSIMWSLNVDDTSTLMFIMFSGFPCFFALFHFVICLLFRTKTKEQRNGGGMGMRLYI